MHGRWMNSKLVLVMVFGLLFMACRKKQKEAIEGVYVGQERYVRFYYSSTDTILDKYYDETLTVKLINKDYFKFTKSTEPYSFEMPSKYLARDNSYSKKEGLIPRKFTTVNVGSNTVECVLEINNAWAGTSEHYYFQGHK